MLDSLRNLGQSWIAKILIGLLIVSVAVFGIPSVFLDLSANTVARVGDQDIGAREFERFYRTRLNQIGAQMGRVPTPEQAVQFGIPGAVLNDLASQAALDSLASRLGLGVTDDELALLVRSDPSFAGTLGVFDRQQFSLVLQQSGLTEAEYLSLQREAAYRQQIAQSLFASVSAPRAASTLAHRYQNDQRTVAYAELDPLLFTDTAEPSEEDLAQFFDENRDNYRAEEVRTVELVILTPQTLAEGIAIDDEAIAARYQRDAAAYESVERRNVVQVLLGAPEARAAFEAAVAEGADFTAAAEEAGVTSTLTDLGLRAQSELTDSTLREAAFGLGEDEIAYITGPLGERAVTVTAIEEATTVPLEDVRDQIETALALEAAQDLQLDAYDAIEETRAAFQPIAEAAEAFGLTVHTVELTRDGAALAEIAELPEDARANVVQRVFETGEDVNVTPAINLGGTSAVFFAIDAVEPERERTLEEAREDVVADWQALEARNATVRAAEDLVAALDAGENLETALAGMGLFPQTSAPFGRSGTGDGLIGPDIASAAFAGDEGHAGYVETQTGSVFVFEVTDAVTAEGEPAGEIAGVIGESLTNNLYGGLMTRLLGEAGLRVNNATLNSIIGLQQP